MWAESDQGIEMWQCSHGNLFSDEETADNCVCALFDDDGGGIIPEEDYCNDPDCQHC